MDGIAKLCTLLKQGKLVVRGTIVFGSNRLLQAEVHIHALSMHLQTKRIVALQYASTTRHVNFHRAPPDERFAEHSFKPEAILHWDELLSAWHSVSDGEWDVATEFTGRVTTPDENVPLRASYPRFLQELSRMQILLGRSIRETRGPQEDLVQAYVRLGHFIEDKNRQVWDKIFLP